MLPGLPIFGLAILVMLPAKLAVMLLAEAAVAEVLLAAAKRNDGDGLEQLALTVC
jgi:hypothetical protein